MKFLMGMILGGIALLVLLVWLLTTKSGETGITRVSIGGIAFPVEVADTLIKRGQGLSGRPGLTEQTGMLFMFSSPGRYGFWMKGMQFPLDIVWINGDEVIGVSENVPLPQDGTWPLHYPPGPVTRVLEINAGEAERFGIVRGQKVEFLVE